MLRFCFLRLQTFLFLLILLAPPFCPAAESYPTLIVTTMVAYLYARQEKDSEIITNLEKGEELLPVGQVIGTGLWYMVKTQKGAIGWVQSADVSGVSLLEDPITIGPLPQCVAQADAADQTRWNKTCAIEGKPKGCALRAPVAAGLDQAHRAYIDECYQRYPEH